MSKKVESGVYFNKLNEQEKESKLFQLLAMAKSEVLVWEKGSNDKLKVEIEGPLSSRMEVRVITSEIKKLLAKNVLVNFSLSGLNFFAQCECFEHNEYYFLKFNGEFYKSERRSNFRLITDPHHDVYVHIETESQENDPSNVVSLKTKTSQTGLFKNFLNLVSEKNDSTINLKNALKLKVLDLSVTGAALQLGELEKTIFEGKSNEFGSLHLDFNGQFFTIPGAKVHYITELKRKSIVGKVYKAGIEFIGVDTNLDEKLSAIINATLRGIDKEFEDFLK